MQNQPIPSIGLVANMFVRQMHFIKAGDVEYGHKHNFDHMTLLAKGSLRVRIKDSDTDFIAPTIIYIAAEHFHELTALSDDTVAYCIHGLRDLNKSDDILDPSMIPKGNDLQAIIKDVRVW